MASSRYEDLSFLPPEERKRIARERWESLPGVVKEIFDNAPPLAMYEVLKRLQVPAKPTRSVEWAYKTPNGSLVVTVWHHDGITAAPDGTLEYFIPTEAWAREGSNERAQAMREVLTANSGKKIHAMLLKHAWDKNDTQYAEAVAADIRQWTVEQLSSSDFLLRRAVRLT
jgi:hypothetical protein